MAGSRVIHGNLDSVGRAKDRLMPHRSTYSINNDGGSKGKGKREDSEGSRVT